MIYVPVCQKTVEQIFFKFWFRTFWWNLKKYLKSAAELSRPTGLLVLIIYVYKLMSVLKLLNKLQKCILLYAKLQIALSTLIHRMHVSTSMPTRYWCNSSVHPSIYHAPVLYRNGSTYIILFSPYGGPAIFPVLKLLRNSNGTSSALYQTSISWLFRWSWVTFEGHFGDLLTVVTLCALVIHDLIAIGKFLVLHCSRDVCICAANWWHSWPH